MTDRLNGVIVTFEKPIRTDDAEPILDAIRMIRGVADVSPIVADLARDYIVRMQCYGDFQDKIYELLKGMRP